MPNWVLFDDQTQTCRDDVLRPSVRPRDGGLGAMKGWHCDVSGAGAVLDIECFGVSEPTSVLLREFGFPEEDVMGRPSPGERVSSNAKLTSHLELGNEYAYIYTAAN